MIKTIAHLTETMHRENTPKWLRLALLDEFTSHHYFDNYEPSDTGDPCPSPRHVIKKEFSEYFGASNRTAVPLWQSKAELLETQGHRDEAVDIRRLITSLDARPRGHEPVRESRIPTHWDRHLVSYAVLPSLKGNIIETITSIKHQATQKRVIATVLVSSEEECRAIQCNYGNCVRFVRRAGHDKPNPGFHGGLFEINIIQAKERRFNRSALINLGLRASYTSGARYTGLVECGDILEADHAEATIAAMDRTHAVLVHCDLHVIDENSRFIDMGGNTAEARTARWLRDVRRRFDQESADALKQGSFVQITGSMLNTEDLAAMDEAAYLCDPRFDKHSTLQEFLLRLAGLLRDKHPDRPLLTYLADKLAMTRVQKYVDEELLGLKLDPRKNNVLIMGYADNVAKGLEPPLTERLATSPPQENEDVYHCVPDLDSSNLVVFKSGCEWVRFEFGDKHEFLRAFTSVSPANPELVDKVVIHNWNYADGFLHTTHNAAVMVDFQKDFKRADFIYPDRAAEARELAAIDEGYGPVLQSEFGASGFHALTGSQKAKFVNRYSLRPKIRDINRFEKKICSQNGEDGIINAIFRKIGTTNRFYVEFGVENGAECNTRYLKEAKNWEGLMMDGRENPGTLIKQEFITAENIQALFRKYTVPDRFDLLSIDLDLNDYWVWKAIVDYRPRVVIIEYNSTVPLNQSKVVAYEAKAMWDGSNYFGASLGALIKLGKEKGYTLVGCENRGINAFFVLDELMGPHFDLPSPEAMFKPPVWGKKINGVHSGYFSNGKAMVAI